MILKKFFLIYVCGLFVVLDFMAYAETPRFGFDVSQLDILDTYLDGDEFSGVVFVENVSNVQITVASRAYFELENWPVVLSPSIQILEPGETKSFNFTAQIPVGVCEKDYRFFVKAVLQGYSQGDGNEVGVGISSAQGYRKQIHIDSNISCDSLVGGGYVFYDKNGNNQYEPTMGEGTVNFGTISLFDFNDSLFKSTDLAVSGGVYSTPSGNLNSITDFYFTVDASKYIGDVLDKTWEGNLYVGRYGRASALATAFVVLDISKYSDLTHDVPLRSRNTDQGGS